MPGAMAMGHSITALAALLLAGCIVVETTEQLLYRMAGKHAGRFFHYTIPAVVLHVAGLGLWFQLLDYVQLGVAQPLMGTSYALIALASRVVFKEKVDARRWAGIALIIAGLAVIGAFER